MAQEKERKTAGWHRSAATVAQANGDGASDLTAAAAYYDEEREHEEEADRLDQEAKQPSAEHEAHNAGEEAMVAEAAADEAERTASTAAADRAAAASERAIAAAERAIAAASRANQAAYGESSHKTVTVDYGHLYDDLDGLLSSSERRDQMGSGAKAILERNRGAVERAALVVDGLVDR